MSVTHKKSEKQIGTAELEALRASIMAEVEAARTETEESIISSIRNNLVSIPEQGEEWNEKKSYITGDVVTYQSWRGHAEKGNSYHLIRRTDQYYNSLMKTKEAAQCQKH